MSHPWDAESFEELFRATAPRLRNYVARQIEHDLVDDVVSETYCLAWRNLERIPSVGGHEKLPSDGHEGARWRS